MVWGLAFRAWGLRLELRDMGFGVPGLGFGGIHFISDIKGLHL